MKRTDRPRAYVLQVDPELVPDDSLRGRVEDLASGEYRHFRTADDLLRFLRSPPQTRIGASGPVWPKHRGPER